MNNTRSSRNGNTSNTTIWRHDGERAGQVGISGGKIIPRDGETAAMAREFTMPRAESDTEKKFSRMLNELEKRTDMRAVRDRWRQRQQGFRLTGSSYQDLQHRLLVFVAVLPVDRSRLFLAMTTEAVMAGLLRWSSAATYWTAIQSATQSINMPQLEDATKVAGHLEKLAHQEVPERKTILLEDLRSRTRDIPEELQTCATCSHILGQRFPDFLQLQFQSLTIITCRSTGKRFLAITIFIGKMVPVIGPWTMHVMAGGTVGRLLINAANSRPEQTAIVSAALVGMGVRAIRRGGLQAMALQRTPATQIRLFSQHKDVPMLMRYLWMGAVLMDQAHTTANIIEKVEPSTDSHEEHCPLTGHTVLQC